MLDTVPEVHLLDRLAVVFKHLRLIGAVFAIVVSIAMLESYSATPLYRSLARIVIQDERSTAIGSLNSTDPAYWQDPEPYFNTQYRILQSRGLARRIVKKLPPPPAAQPSAFARAVSLPRQLLNRWRSKPAAAPEGDKPARDETAEEGAAIGAFLAGLEIVPVRATPAGGNRLHLAGSRIRRARRQHRSPTSTCSTTSTRSCRTPTARSTG